jgi:hypothetical protein
MRFSPFQPPPKRLKNSTACEGGRASESPAIISVGVLNTHFSFYLKREKSEEESSSKSKRGEIGEGKRVCALSNQILTRREGSRTDISSARNWEDLLAAHEKWLLDFNYQHRFAHKQREDGCHKRMRNR